MKTFRYLLISCFGARFAFTLLPVKALRTTAHRSTSKQNAHLGSKQGDRSLADAEANESTFTETACFDQKINAFLKENNIPGAGLAVLKDGKMWVCMLRLSVSSIFDHLFYLTSSVVVLHSVYAQGYGYRDVPGIGDPATLRKASQCTPFRLASVSKPVTSLAILRLLQDKKLSLNDKVFGPGGILQSMSDNPKQCCPIKDNRILDVTVYHLLTHTGGWDRDLDVTMLTPCFNPAKSLQR